MSEFWTRLLICSLAGCLAVVVGRCAIRPEEDE